MAVLSTYSVLLTAYVETYSEIVVSTETRDEQLYFFRVYICAVKNIFLVVPWCN
jgi:hypothetical protein